MALITVFALLFVPEDFLLVLLEVTALDFAVAPLACAAEVAEETEPTVTEDPGVEVAVGPVAGDIIVFGG